MLAKFVSLTLSLGLIGTVAAAKPRRIYIDQGNITLSLVAGANSQKVTFDLPANCANTRVNVAESSGSIRVTHAGQHCPSGANVQIPASADSDVSVEVGAGDLSVVATSAVLALFSTVALKVEAGMIKSSLVKSSRTNNYAGAQGELKNGNSGYCLDVRVKSGMISL